uniref:Ubiquitin-like domain-containing protein n=1 Tax=Podarcis muralis TaxID=64176 RepID=A0A670IHS5_PODMU
MDVFLLTRRSNMTIFTDAKESSTVYELKRVVEGILKRPPEEQRLYKDGCFLLFLFMFSFAVTCPGALW